MKWAADVASIGETKLACGTREETDNLWQSNREIILKPILKKYVLSPSFEYFLNVRNFS